MIVALILWTLGAVAVLVGIGWDSGPPGLMLAGLIYLVGGTVILRGRRPFR